jgi:dienelactone hydrolase
MLRMLIAVTGLMGAGMALAAPVTKTVTYKIGDTEFNSTLVYDDSSKASRPGSVMAPNWYGANEASIAKAKTIAGKDYVILLADVYGKDVRPKNDDEATKAMTAASGDRTALRARINAALEALKGQAKEAPLDTRHIGAIGFCFGGAVVLDLARSGADVQGVVTFHGNLKSDDPALAKNIKGSVLVLNGAEDKYIADQVAGFEKEMKDAGVDYQFVNLAGAVHCFAEPDQNNPPGCVYNPRAAKRAYRMMHAHFDEVFAAK